MKQTKRTHFLFMTAIVAALAVGTWSCNKDDDPSLEDLRNDKIAYLADSLRISDSLRLTNNAGAVNYAITVVDGSTSSIFTNSGGGWGSRTEKTLSAVDGAVVTISQFGKIQKDTTDASGVVVFNGFFRSAVNITIQKTDYTSVSYISAVNIQDSTRTGTISFVGNLIPIFPKTGPTTATISGRATIETNLTNRTREVVPDGTTVSASIDARNSDFSDRFLTTDVDFDYTSGCGCEFIYVGNILQAAYNTGVVGSVTGGNYTLTVPAAIDGLPMTLQYSDVGADQTLFENGPSGQRTIVRRTVFYDNSNTFSTPLASLPASSNVNVSFVSNDADATATAVISPTTGQVDRINVTNGGSNYNNAPRVVITGGGGTGATADAVVTGGVVTGITITNAGTGYTSAPGVAIVAGSGADADAALGGTGTVVALNLLTTGAGYTSAPTVTISGGGATTDATASATVANGRVTALTLLTGGIGYDGITPITVTIAGGGATTDATASAVFSGLPVGVVTLNTGGSNYNYAPIVTFSVPEMPNGVRATGTATINLATRQVTGISVTNSGSGYLNPPTITMNAGSGATAQSFLAGGSVISFNITSEGSNYAYPPTVVIGSTTNGNGSGATGTAIMSGGRVVGINLVNAGSGYTSAPDVRLVVGSGAVAHATISEGVITGFVVTDGGHDFAGAPRVVITGDGGGATATATVAGGQITAITPVTGGSGYLEGNTPSSALRFTATKGTTLETKPGINYINDIYYGTGAERE